MNRKIIKYFLIMIFTILIMPLKINAVKYTTFSNGTEIYFNPETGLTCTREEYDNNLDASRTGNNIGCMKWYVFLDDENSKTVDMLLDHNTTNKIRWSSTNYNDTNADVLLEGLELDTIDWKDNLHPRIITAEEIIDILGNDSFDLSVNSELSFTSEFGWLNDRIRDCRSYGKVCYNNAINTSEEYTYGYWTTTPANSTTGENKMAWVIFRDGDLTKRIVTIDYSLGIRPVITVDKSLIANSIFKEIENGKINTNLEIAKENEEIYFEIIPNEGYELKNFKVIDDNGNEILVNENKFIMPNSDVTISAKLKKIKTELIEKSEENPKTDDNISNYKLLLLFSLSLFTYFLFIKIKKVSIHN